MLEQFDEDTDKEVVRALKSDPRVYVRNAWQHPTRTGDRYDFRTTEGEKLNYMLHDDGPLNPSNWGDINIFLMCRGGLKSTMTRMIFNWAHDSFPALDSYFVAPTNNSVTNWTSNFTKNVSESGLDSRRIVNNKTYQKFEVERERDDGTTYPVQGEFQTDSGYNEESVRGPHSQCGLVDEGQDLKKEVFDAYLPAIDAHHPEMSVFPTVFMIGTPKETGTLFHDLWEMSDQKTWDDERKTYVQQNDPEPYKIGESAAEELGIDLDEVEDKTVRAWHLDWMNSPKHSDGQLVQAKAQMSQMKFTNEVKAEFYDPEDNLLTVSDVKEIFDPTQSFFERRVGEESTVVLGVDWGGGKDENAADTVLAVCEQTEYDDLTDTTLLNIEFLDDALSKRQQIRKVEEWIRKYDVDTAIIDYGYGSQAMESLQDGNDTVEPDGYADTVTACRFGNVKNKGDIKFEQSSGEERFFTCDKTRNVSRMVDWIRDERLTIPSNDMDEGHDSATREKLLNHLTSAYKTLNETPTGNKKVRIETPASRNDDALDALVFCWLGLHEIDSTDYYVNYSSNSRAGYS